MNASRRFFVEGKRDVGGVVEIEGSDAHKIAHVLRLTRGDRIELVDSGAAAFEAALEVVGSVVRAQILRSIEALASDRPSPPVDVAQAVPKGSRMDFVIEKGTELGANAFVPFYSERSVARADGTEKIARWRRLARSAAQQSGRRDIPNVAEPADFRELLERFDAYRTVLFAWELAPPVPLCKRLNDLPLADGSILIVVGPEGGFTHDEADAAQERDATLISLGARVLRTDTAAMVLLAVIGALAS